MLKIIKERLDRERQEEGFTLIELMVVVLIIAILLAIAIPTFLGARNTANARAAESNLRNALTAEKTIWTQNQAYSATIATLQANENALGWTTGQATSGTPNQVAVAVDGTGNIVGLYAEGKDGNCYAIQDVAQPTTSGGTTYQAGTTYFKNSGACPTTPAAPVSGVGTGASSPSGASW